MKEGTLTSIAWGLFVILIGGLWIAAEMTRLDMGAYFALGVGLILVGLNFGRRSIGGKISRFGLGLGIVALLVGISGIGGLRLSLIPTIIIVIGIFIVAEAIAKRSSG